MGSCVFGVQCTAVRSLSVKPFQFNLCGLTGHIILLKDNIFIEEVTCHDETYLPSLMLRLVIRDKVSDTGMTRSESPYRLYFSYTVSCYYPHPLDKDAHHLFVRSFTRPGGFSLLVQDPILTIVVLKIISVLVIWINQNGSR